MQNPVWLTLIGGVGGAVIALLASVATTLLTSNYAIRRQEVELSHARELETAKALFAARYDLYATVQDAIADADQYYRWVTEEYKIGFTPIKSLYPNDSSMRVTRQAKELKEKATLISSKPVMDSADDYYRAILKTNGILQAVRDSGNRKIEGELPPVELSRCASSLTRQIRIELGVATDSDDSP